MDYHISHSVITLILCPHRKPTAVQICNYDKSVPPLSLMILFKAIVAQKASIFCQCSVSLIYLHVDFTTLFRHSLDGVLTLSRTQGCTSSHICHFLQSFHIQLLITMGLNWTGVNMNSSFYNDPTADRVGPWSTWRTELTFKQTQLPSVIQLQDRKIEARSRRISICAPCLTQLN